MNVCLYVFYRNVNYTFDHVMIFRKVLCMSPQRFLSWYDQLCPTAPNDEQPHDLQPSHATPDYDSSANIPNVQHYTAKLWQRVATPESSSGFLNLWNCWSRKNCLRKPKRPLHATPSRSTRSSGQTPAKHNPY